MQALLKVHTVPVDANRIEPDPEAILQLLGEEQGNINSHTRELVDLYIVECLRKSTPEGAFIITEALDPDAAGTIRIPGEIFHTGSIIQKMLRHAEQYAFFLATAGPGPELLTRSLMSQGNYLEGYIVDLVASSIVDLAADRVQAQVRKQMLAGGKQITNRYSPGYCSWKVEEQQKLFSLFPGGCCNISLSESSLMNPIKSISGIIGAGARVKYQEYTCEICSMPNCHFRRTRAH